MKQIISYSLATLTKLCMTWVSHSGLLLGCDSVSLGEWSSPLQRNIRNHLPSDMVLHPRRHHSIFKIMLIHAVVQSKIIHTQLWHSSPWTYLHFSVHEWMCQLNATSISTTQDLYDSSLCNRTVSLCYQESSIYHLMLGRSSQWPW